MIKLQTLIGELAAESFFKDFWTKKEYLNNSSYFSEEWFGLKDLEQIIRMTAESPIKPEMRVISFGKKLAPTHYQVTGSNVLSLEKLGKLYKDGASLSLRRINEHHPVLYEFTSALATEFNEQAQINAYLTPRNSQGFDVHYDHHEIFILQLKGEKHWSLYNLHPYPLPANGYYDQGQPDKQSARQYILKAGDVLYIPRGMWHEARTDDTSSLHLTLNIKCRLKVEFLHWMINQLAGSNAELRKNLSGSPLKPMDDDVELLKHLKTLTFDQLSLSKYQEQFTKQTPFYLPFDQ